MLWAILDLSQYLFRVSAASLRGNSGECGVWSLCKVAYVCHPAGWLADLNRRHSVLTDVAALSPFRKRS